MEEAEEVGVEAAEEIEVAEVVLPKKEIKFSDEKRSKLEIPNEEKFELDSRNHPIHVESAKLKSICSILNIDSQTFALKGQFSTVMHSGCGGLMEGVEGMPPTPLICPK